MVVFFLRGQVRPHLVSYLVRLMIGVQTVKIIKVIAAFSARLAAAVDQSVIDNVLTSGVNVFAHVWVQALDTLSNFCDNNNIHSSI